MRLYVTEKPNAGKMLANFFAKKKNVTPEKEAYCIKVGDDVVAWARGHLLAQADPDYYFKDKGIETKADGKIAWAKIPLPIIPEQFVYVPTDSKDIDSQLNALKKLMLKADVIYNAADKDREGQLIFDELVDYFKITNKPIKRLWFSALNDKAFEDALANPMDNNDPLIKNMGVAALARGQADWIIGMNATRATSLAHGRADDGVFSVGRVQTPTLAIVVKRYLEIENFISVPFYTPVIEVNKTQLTWEKRLVENQLGIVGGRILDKELAVTTVNRINQGLQGEVIECQGVQKEKTPPLPYSLPVIQAELSKKLGLPVNQIESVCQSLYEKGMITYIGTGCQYLPESMLSEARGVLTGIIQSNKFPQFNQIIKGANLSIKSPCWNDKKVNGDGSNEAIGASHHGIIPTGSVIGELGITEKAVYEAIVRRYVAQFYPNYIYYSVSLKCQFDQDVFSANETAPMSYGWHEVINEEEDNAETQS